MKTYYLKIRDKFIADIKNRVKKHEYRLASPERMQAKVGDTFVLISNQNQESFVRATIKGIKVYSSWNEALIENWEQDFKNLFPSLEATLKECYKFYSKEEVALLLDNDERKRELMQVFLEDVYKILKEE